ncbi:MAG: tetratricopeptide repeat protein [Chitinophagaceae bacterium]|nr:tetratricopeptide repeat protein [Chitinophagaceae bacterium]
MLLLFCSHALMAQKSPVALQMAKKAMADSTAKKYGEAATGFANAAIEEAKQATPDAVFIASVYWRAATLFEATLQFATAHDCYYKSLSQYQKLKDYNHASQLLTSIAALYKSTSEKKVTYSYPKPKSEETIVAHRTIETLQKQADGSFLAIIEGGSNDGLYEGADATVYGKHRKTGEDRANRELGTAKVLEVAPNYSKVRINVINPRDSFFAVYTEDMVAVPIRFPKKEIKDVFLEVSLLNIRFLDNYRESLAHTRTLMYYPSAQLEKDVYQRMLDAVVEIYDMIKDDSSYKATETIQRGRFKGITWKEAMGKSTPADLKAFLGFVRTFPGKYMGGNWKISETYATWLLNNCPVGSNELMDSLLAAKNDKEIFAIANYYKKEIKDVLFIQWLTDAQKMAGADRIEEAYKWSSIILKVVMPFNDPDMTGWSYFNLARIQDEDKKDTLAIENYKKAIPYFEKGTDAKGLSYCINNLASIYSKQYQYAEAQHTFEKVLDIRIKVLKTDTSDEQKNLVARAYWGVGDAFYNQSKYKEAIEQYSKGAAVIENARLLDCRILTAHLYRWIGKSHEKMANYLEAANFYQKEYSARVLLGDVDAQADALDNQGLLFSKLGKYREAHDKFNFGYQHHLKIQDKNGAGYSMSNMGQMLWNLGKFDSAIMAHTNAIQLRTEGGNEKGVAYSLKKLGALYKESGNASKSMESYNKALALYQKLDDNEEYGSLLEDLGSNYATLKDYGNSKLYYTQALSLYRKIKSRNKEADVLSSIGDMLYGGSKYVEADLYFDSASVIQKEINDRSGLMYSMINKGQISQFSREDYKDAIEKMRVGLDLAVATNSQFHVAFCQSKIGGLFSYMSNYDSAVRYFDLAMEGYKKLDDKEKIAYLEIDYGYYYNYRGDFEKAKLQFEKALAIGKEINNGYLMASAYNGLSGNHSVKGEFKEAMSNTNEVLKIYKEKDNPWGIASVYLSMADILNDQGEYEEALASYYKADSMYKTLGLEKIRNSVANNIGTIYFYQHNYQAALQQFTKIQAALDKNNDDPPFQALIKSNIGEIYIENKKEAEAQKYLVESLKMGFDQKNVRQLYISHLLYGRLLTNQKKFAQAEAEFRSTDSLLANGGEQKIKIQLLENWGRMLYMNNRPAEAEAKLKECVQLSEKILYSKYAWKAYATLADVKIAGNDEKAGIGYLEKSISEVEKIKTKLAGKDARKIFSSDESIVELYKKMILILKKQGRVPEALVYMEKANAENVNIRLNADAVTYTDPAANEAVAKSKELQKQQTIIEGQIAKEKAKPEEIQHKEQIVQWEKMRSITAEQYKSYVNDLKVKYPNLPAFKTVDPGEFMAQRRRIPSDVAVVSYLVTDKEMSVFVVMKDTIFIKDIPIDKELLQNKIRSFYAAHARSSKSARDIRGGKVSAADNSKKPKEDASQMAADLYNILVAPYMDDLKDKQRIAIVPSGLLCFVPFDALIRKSADGKSDYMGDIKQLFYVNKITTVTNSLGEPMTDFRILAAGNPDKSLPNAEKEVNALQTLMPNTTVYVREQATKKNVLGNKGDFNVLHLATHGMLDYANADSSYLVFASDPVAHDNGKLTIKEIQATLDIDRFGIILLSACETAVIREVAEGWPISMGTAFIEMGVPSVVATLWQVDDNATSMLMQQFYKNLKTMDKVKALQQAQHYLRTQPGYEDPYYWAPFQLVGVWK